VGTDELWVIAHNGERGILEGNPHTHPGRFSVRWESTGLTHPTSLSDLADMSAEASVWLRGFMSGNEPDVYDVLGLDDGVEPTDGQYEVWRRQLADFRQTGSIRLPIRGLEDASPDVS
jgi:hypothetical protein